MKILTNKNLKTAVELIARNHRIALEALYKSGLPPVDLAPKLDKVLDNSMKAAYAIGGRAGVQLFIQSYFTNH